MKLNSSKFERMKRIGTLLLVLLLTNCSDGDLQIETLDFDSVTNQDCGNVSATTSNILFKINGSEALILDLESGVLNNGTSITDTIETRSSVPGSSRVIYRVFSDNVTSTYFCDDFPPSEPSVIEEIEAEDGEVIIKSIANADSTAITHVIQLEGISLVNTSGERITDLSISDFGELSVSASN